MLGGGVAGAGETTATVAVWCDGRRMREMGWDWRVRSSFMSETANKITEIGTGEEGVGLERGR